MNGKRKQLMFSVLILMIISVCGIVGYYWYENTYYVSTEDARVAADIVKASPQISSKLLELNFDEGQVVQKDQILGRQEMGSLPDYNMDMSIIRAPITGIVIKKQGTIGEIVSPGQALAMLIDPNKIYITANIEETKLSKVKPGQVADVTIDEYSGIKFKGKVDSIGEASAATFSLLPSSSGSTFTKVVQKVPVKIVLDKNNVKLLPGINAVIKIHVK